MHILYNTVKNDQKMDNQKSLNAGSIWTSVQGKCLVNKPPQAAILLVDNAPGWQIVRKNK